jgi:multiple sugar transport system substrate-binding protein
MVLGAKTAMQFYDRDAPEEMAAKGMNAIVDIIGNPAQLDSILSALDKERVRIYAAQ